MDMRISGIKKATRCTAGAAALVLLSALIFISTATAASSGSDRRFTVFKAEFDITPVRNKDEKIVKDYYVNAGKLDGVTASTVFDVYREKTISDTFQGKETKISILIGQLEVIKVFEDIVITRIAGLAYSEDTPVVRYRSVMIGDYAVPVKKAVLTGEISVPPDSPAEPRMIAAIKPKLYSVLPVSLRGGNQPSPGVSFPSHVLFDFDDWKLKPEAMQAIDEVIDTYNKSRDREIIIEGHTCSLGEHGYNIELSHKRAGSVADYLINIRGIPAEDIRVEYYGELFPVASNDDETGREKNRRVDIRFLPLNKKDRLLQSLARK